MIPPSIYDTLTHTVNVMVLLLIKGYNDSKGSLKRPNIPKRPKLK